LIFRQLQPGARKFVRPNITFVLKNRWTVSWL